MFQFSVSRHYDFFICHIYFGNLMEKSNRKHAPKANNPNQQLMHARNYFKNKIF